jgi:formyltetrahydrofolate deformylase
MMVGGDVIMTMRAPDRPGLVADMTTALAAEGCDIRDAAVFGDRDTRTFFVRMHLAGAGADPARLAAATSPVASKLRADVRFYKQRQAMPIVVAVSRFGHCLSDLLHRWAAGSLPVEIAAVVSNHEEMRGLTEWHDVPFHYLPVAEGEKREQERRLLDVVAATGAELLVLARYMQVLSPDACAALDGRCINIHHSFLPSFVGAKPYHQAHLRGVKLIGATAHYVTAELDQGPIIEQDVRRVTHAALLEDLIAEGREVEARVLSRAVRWHAERRVFISGHKTIILS